MAAKAAPVIVVTRGIRIFKMRIILEIEDQRANRLAKATSIHELAQQRALSGPSDSFVRNVSKALG
jgi:hypothetical protein